MRDHSFSKVLQKAWDWRAAGNFVLGGTGSGLLLLVAALNFPANPPVLVGIAATCLVAAGLTLVWLEIGRPLRFLNVLLNPWTSWMSREAFVAAALFALVISGTWLNLPWLMGLAGIFAGFFLYCQARILKAAKGVPAWREPAIVPLIIITGLTEGAGLLLVLHAAIGIADQRLQSVFAVLLMLRLFSWIHYRRRIEAGGAPAAARVALKTINTHATISADIIPLFLLAAGLMLSSYAVLLIVAAGVLAVLGGWLIKSTIVVRAAHYQGFALSRPTRAARGI